VAEALALETTERPAELLSLLTNDVGPELPVPAPAVPFETEALGKVEHDRDRQAVVASREGDERVARFPLHVGRVHDDETPRGEPLAGESVVVTTQKVGTA